MKKKLEFKTWLESIEANKFDEWTKNMVINEMPHTHFVGNIPPEFTFLSGSFVDMGFENLGTPEDYRRLLLAFGGTGLLVPGTRYRIRHATPGHSQIEFADGTETETLPGHWKQGVTVMNNQDKFSWIGKKARPDLIGNVDMKQYRDAGDGWILTGLSGENPPSPAITGLFVI